MLRGFGIALCPTGVIGFLFQYLQEKVFVQKVKDLILSNLILQEVGIKRVFHNRDEFDQIRLRLYHDAKYRIYYLAVCPGYRSPGTLRKIVKDLLKKEIEFKFLICDPNNPFMTQWFEIHSSKYPTYTKQDIMNCIRDFYTIKKGNRERGKIDIRIYTSSPGYYMQIIDDRLFVEPYLYGSFGYDALMIEFGTGKQFNLFFRHFETLWNVSIPVEDFLKCKVQ